MPCTALIAPRKDADGELSDADEAAYAAACLRAVRDDLGIWVSSHWEVDHMRLYHDTVTPSILGLGSQFARGWVDAWWFQCPTCHTLLPAQFHDRV